MLRGLFDNWVLALYPRLSVLNIVLDGIDDFFCIWDAHHLEFHITELDREIGIVLPCDDDSAFIDLRADFEADAIVREEDELGGISNYFLC